MENLRKIFPIKISIKRSKKKVFLVFQFSSETAKKSLWIYYRKTKREFKNFFSRKYTLLRKKCNIIYGALQKKTFRWNRKVEKLVWVYYKKSYRFLKSHGHVFQQYLNVMKRALRKIYRDVVKVFENFFSEIGDKQLEILNDLREYKQELIIIFLEEYSRLRKEVHIYIRHTPRKITILQKYINKRIQISYKKSYRLMRSWSIVFQRRFNSYKKFLINRYADKIIIFYKQLILIVVEYIRLVSQNVFEHISKYDTSLNIKQRHLTLLKKLTAVVLNITVIAMSLAPAIYFVARPGIALADTETLRPNATGTYQEWPTLVDTTHNGATSDQNNATYIETGTDEDRDIQNLDNTTFPAENTIDQIEVFITCKANNGSGQGENAATLIREGGTDTEGVSTVLNRTSFTDISTVYTTNPRTASAWLQSELDALEAGARLKKIQATEAVQCSEIRVVVTHTAPPAEITVSGTLYSDEGSSQLDGGSITVQLRVATATPGVFSTTTDSGSGAWQITNIDTTGMGVGTPISVWIDGDANTRAFTLTKASSTASGANITGLDLYQNRIIMKHEATSGTSTTNADLAFFDNDNDSDIQFTSVAGGLLSVFKDQELHIWDGDTFAPGGAITIHGNASSTTDGSLHIDDNATLTAGGAISVAGNWDADTGSTFTEGGNTVTFNATTTGKTIAGTLTGSSAFGNLTFNGSGGAWTFSNNASTTDFTITNGGVTAPTLLTVGGNYSNSGDFTDNSGTVFFSGSGI
ncbi:hypothetical protein IIA95_03790, partial [Patescibacteria group bacterium]|nr:hypothetical protein [Patescibacteria group bacterium]